MQCKNDDMKLDTDMNIENRLIKGYIHQGSHRSIQRERNPGMIQSARRIHHMLVKRRRDLVSSTAHIVPITDRNPRNSSLPRGEPPRLHRRQSYDMLTNMQIRGSSTHIR